MSVANIFETLMVTGVTSGLDNQQTALAVQALLESQSLTEAPPAVEEDDLFQCGKCKKQFNNISLFVSHKQSHCSPVLPGIGLRQGINGAGGQTGASLGTAALKQLPSYSSSVPSTLAQALGHNIVLADDLMSFTTPVDQTIPTSTLQVGSNPFLSQVSPPPPHSSASNTLLVPTSSIPAFSSSTNSTFSTVLQGNGNLPGTSLLPGNHALPGSQASLSSSHIQLQAVPTVVTPQAASLLGPQTTDSASGTHVIIQTSNAPTVLSPGGAGDGNLITTSAPIGKSLAGSSLLRTSGSKTGSRKLTSLTLSNGQIAVIAEDEPPGLPAGPAHPPPPPVTQPTKSRRTKPLPEEPNAKKKLKCQYCDKTFAKNFDLQQHVRSHTGEKPFQCIVCGRAFAQKSNVKKHMQTHKVWPQGTGKTLPSQPAPKLISHQEEGAEKVNVPQEGPQEVTPPVKTIEMSVNKKKALTDGTEQPVKVNVVIDSSYMCQYCPYKFKSYFQLKSHMLQHKGEQVYKCIVKSCNITFHELDSFLEHTKSHEDNMNYRCHICNKTFPSLYELGVHQYSHSLYPNQGPKPGPRYFRCVKCNNKYSTPEALQHHLDTVSHKHQCPHCYKIFTCERYLRRHLPIHGSTGPHACEECGKQFKTEHYLKVHLLTHSSEKPFGCDHCNAAFNRKDKLKRHMLVHETTKKFRCPFRSHLGCTKEFNRPDKLKAHIICHSGIKPFKCKECGKTFTRRPNLRQHERGHRKDWSHKCERCGKGFLRDKLFKMHKCRILNNSNVKLTSQSTDNSKDQDGFVPTEVPPKRDFLRKKMISMNKGLYKSLRGSTSRRGRPRKNVRMMNQAPPAEEQEELVPEDHTITLQTVQEAQETVTMDISSIETYPSDVGDLQATEISVVLADDTQYITSQDEESAVITNEDGNVVVIQPLSQIPPSSFTGSIQEAISVQTAESELQYEDVKPEGVVNTIQSGPLTPSARVTEIVSSYNLDYSPGIYQTSYAGANFQNATFITTGPNMATLVVEGPGGEVLSHESIATIVAQAPDQFSDGTQQTYNVLEYPMTAKVDDGETQVAIMATHDIVTEEDSISVNDCVKCEDSTLAPS